MSIQTISRRHGFKVIGRVSLETDRTKIRDLLDESCDQFRIGPYLFKRNDMGISDTRRFTCVVDGPKIGVVFEIKVPFLSRENDDLLDIRRYVFKTGPGFGVHSRAFSSKKFTLNRDASAQQLATPELIRSTINSFCRQFHVAARVALEPDRKTVGRILEGNMPRIKIGKYTFKWVTHQKHKAIVYSAPVPNHDGFSISLLVYPTVLKCDLSTPNVVRHVVPIKAVDAEFDVLELLSESKIDEAIEQELVRCKPMRVGARVRLEDTTSISIVRDGKIRQFKIGPYVFELESIPDQDSRDCATYVCYTDTHISIYLVASENNVLNVFTHDEYKNSFQHHWNTKSVHTRTGDSLTDLVTKADLDTLMKRAGARIKKGF